MQIACRDGAYRLASQHAGAHQHRPGACGGAAVSELAVVIPAPARQAAVRAAHQVVRATRRDCDHRLAGEHAAAIHQHRHARVGGAAIAQLAVIIVTPGRHRTIGTQDEVVVPARAGGDHPLAGEHATAVHQSRNIRVRTAAVTQLTRVADAPARQGAVRAQDQVVGTGRRDADNPFAGQHSGLIDRHGFRRVAGDSGAAQLTVVVAAP